MLKVLVVEDDGGYVDELRAEVLAEAPVRCDVRFAADAEAAGRAVRRFRPDLVLLDMTFPLEPGGKLVMDAGAEMIDLLRRELPSARVVALSSQDRDFAVRLLTRKRIDDFVFKDLDWGEIRARLHRHLEAAAADKRASLMEEEGSPSSGGPVFLGQDPATAALLAKADKVAATDTTVLLLGESGTGKEVLARRIHERSPRRESSFVAVNCGALDENLTRSELFGHVKGAFTGAVADRAGRFEVAHGGTLFLDEVGELSAANQVRLLRVLEERTFERVGSTDLIETDVRLVAATNRDLEAMVAGGGFRQDLFFRLHVFPLHIPPLRQRKKDVALLAEHFVRLHAKRLGKRIEGIAEDVAATVLAYHWPGNARQLSNVMEHAVILESSDRIRSESLPPLVDLGAATAKTTSLFRPGVTYHQSLEDWERRLFLEALGTVDGDTAKVADSLGLPLRTLQRRLKTLGIKASDYR